MPSVRWVDKRYLSRAKRDIFQLHDVSPELFSIQFLGSALLCELNLGAPKPHPSWRI